MRQRIVPILLVLMLAVAGCATRPPEAGPGRPAAPRAESTAPAANAAPAGKADGDKNGRLAPVLVSGNDLMIAKPSAREAVSFAGKGVNLHFEAVPAADVVQAVLGDLLKLDYAIVTPLPGEITVHTQKDVPRDQVLTLLDSLLQAHGILMVPDAAGRYRIGTAEALKGAVPIPRRTTALPTGFGSVIVPLQYISAAEMADILRPVASDQALLRVDTVRNLLMLAGSRSQIEGWLEIINTFDVDFLKGMSIGLFPLTYSSVKDVELALRALIGGDAAPAGTGGQAPGAARAPGAGGDQRAAAAATAVAAAQSQVPTPLAGLVRVMPIERLNALLVVTPRAHYLEQARQWIERFDRPTDSEADATLYVYPVQNGSAMHLASLLNGLYGSTTGKSPGDSGVAPGLSGGTQTSRSTTYDAFGASTGRSFSSGSPFGTGSLGLSGFGTAQGGGQAAQNANAVAQISLGDNVRVVADQANNALLIHANRREYRRIEAALRQLDIAPTQVLIEANILEVTLTDDIKYGLQWYFNDTVRGGWSGLGQLTSGSSNTIGTSNPGFSYSLLDTAGSVRAVLTALADKSLLKVISNPSLMVLDNHTALIQVGDQQPVRSSQTITDGGTSMTSIQYKDTGVALAVTPSVNAGDMVSMVVDQSITDVGDIDEATEQRSFLRRQISSRVAVRSGQTIVLGGLIRDNNTRGKLGIPVLHELPVVGNLFGTTTISTRRTELLVAITPRVVRTELDVRDVGAELRERMRTLDVLGERGRRGLGGQDVPREAPPAVPGEPPPPAAE